MLMLQVSAAKKQFLLEIPSNLAKALVKYALFNIFQRQSNSLK